MKKLLLILIFSGICLSSCIGQLVISKISKNDKIKVDQDIAIDATAGTVAILQHGELETTGELSFADATLDLRNITIKAKKIVIQATVGTIIISDNVIFNCEEIEFQAGGNLVIQNRNKAEFSILYSNQVTNSRTIVTQPLNKNSFIFRCESVK